MLTHGRCGFSFSGRGGVSLAPLPSILVHFIFITTAMLKVKLANLLKSLSVKTDNLYVAGFLPLNAVYPTPKSSNYNYSFIKAVRAFGPVIFMMTHVQAQPSNNSFSTVDVSSIVGNPAIDSTIRASSYDYLIALIEQDTVSSLRYGILFLLALSSLGVYSIILAG
jgi:hypothetical protein